MKINKTIIAVSLLISVAILGAFYFFNQENASLNVNNNASKDIVYFFYSPTCSACAKEKPFLDSLEAKYPELEIKRLAVFEKENAEFLKSFYQDYDVPLRVQGLVPITFIGERYFPGFSEDISQEIEEEILVLLGEEMEPLPDNPDLLDTIKIPFLGEFKTHNFSPLLSAIVLGSLDGFNACAMVALGFLLAVLISTGVRKRVFLIGGTFILVSGMVYFVFIAAWLNLFLCLTHISFLTVLIGIIIILFSVFLLKDYFQGVICKLCQIEEKENILTKFQGKLFEKIKRFSDPKISLPLMIGGVALVAAGVNMVELCCSFGFPLAFTKILTSWNLSTPSYYFYLLIYVIFYMLDDFLIFILAVSTLRITQASEKYLRIIKLISGILLFILGFLMLIKPELLIL